MSLKSILAHWYPKLYSWFISSHFILINAKIRSDPNWSWGLEKPCKWIFATMAHLSGNHAMARHIQSIMHEHWGRTPKVKGSRPVFTSLPLQNILIRFVAISASFTGHMRVSTLDTCISGGSGPLNTTNVDRVNKKSEFRSVPWVIHSLVLDTSRYFV